MILTPKTEKDYELLDSGNGEKLERYGAYILRRPDKEAIWNKSDEGIWKKADLTFKRDGNKTKWLINKDVPKEWIISCANLNFIIRPTSFKHTGLFPEQESNWQWVSDLIKKEKRKISVLNLFAYTGGATLACAKSGAEVCHVDGSKQAVFWARENAKISGLENEPIRWIIDDVIVFLKREIKRGRKYDAIIMDPPSFGHGPKDELWKIEEDFLELIKLCKEVLSSDPIFILINGYTAGYSSIAYENNLREMFDYGVFEKGELAILETSGNKLLPCGIFARWRK